MVSKVKKFFSKEVRSLIYFVTTKCQLKCKHCLYSAELNKSVNELTLEEIEKVAKNLPYLETIQVSGGEPFLRTDLPEVLEIFAKRCKNLKQVGIPTNGYATDLILSQVKKMEEILKLYNVRLHISVSIDGFRELHNEIRGAECFDKAIETFKRLRKNNIRAGFNASLSKINYEIYIDLLKFLKTLGPDEICINLVRAKPNIMLSAEEFKKIRGEIEKTIVDFRTPFYRKRQKLLNDACYKVLKGEKLPFRCLAGKIIGVLEPDGGVRSCELRPVLGNVRDYDYDVNKILKLDNIPKDCSCIHGCFVGPSMSYSFKYLVKNILGGGFP